MTKIKQLLRYHFAETKVHRKLASIFLRSPLLIQIGAFAWRGSLTINVFLKIMSAAHGYSVQSL